MWLLARFIPTILFISNIIFAQSNFKNYNECIFIWNKPYLNYFPKEYHYSEDYEYFLCKDTLRGEYYSFLFESTKQGIELNKKELQEYFYYLIKRNGALLKYNDNDMVIQYHCKECKYWIIISFYNYPIKSYIIEIINNKK